SCKRRPWASFPTSRPDAQPRLCSPLKSRCASCCGEEPMNGAQIWQAAQEELRFQLSKPSYETWLKNASLVGREKNAFKIGVPTKLAKDWLEDRYSAMIKETLSAIVSGDVSVAFEVVPGQAEVQGSRGAVAVAEAPPPQEAED